MTPAVRHAARSCPRRASTAVACENCSAHRSSVRYFIQPEPKHFGHGRRTRRVRLAEPPLLRGKAGEAGPNPLRLIEQRLEHEHVTGLRKRLRIGHRRWSARKRVWLGGRGDSSWNRARVRRKAPIGRREAPPFRREPPQRPDHHHEQRLDQAAAEHERGATRSVAQVGRVSAGDQHGHSRLEAHERGRRSECDDEATGESPQRRRHNRRQVAVTRERSEEDRQRHPRRGKEHHRGAAPVGALKRSEAHRDGADRPEHADRGLADGEPGDQRHCDSHSAPQRRSPFELRPVDDECGSEEPPERAAHGCR